MLFNSKKNQNAEVQKLGRRILVGLALIICLGILPSGVWGKDIKVLKIGIGADPETLVPFEITSMVASNIARLMYGSMMRYSDDGKLIPSMATSWKFSADGLTLTMNLRKGVRFTDGSELDAHGYKYYFDLQQDPKIRVPYRFLLSNVKSTRVLDDYTFQYVLKAPFAPMDQVAGLGTPMSVKVLKPFDIDRIRKEHVVAGPYKLEKWVKGERIVLVRNEDYWGKRPTVEKLVYLIIPESATRVAMLRAGQLDIAYSPSPPDIKSLEADRNFKVARPLSSRMIFIGMNTQKGYTRNKYFRQALNYAIDKKAICERVNFGVSKPLDSPIPPSLFGHSKMARQYTYNPEKAKALLKKAGFPPNTKISLLSPVGRYTYDKEIAETVQAYLQNIGVNAQLRTYDWPTYMSLIFKPLDKSENQLFLLGWGASYYDADFSTFMLFSSYVHPPRGLNATFYSNKEFDKLTYMARSVVDKKKRLALYDKALQILWDDAPAIWLHVEPVSIAYSAKYKGIRLLSNEKCYPQYMTYR